MDVVVGEWVEVDVDDKREVMNNWRSVSTNASGSQVGQTREVVRRVVREI